MMDRAHLEEATTTGELEVAGVLLVVTCLFELAGLARLAKALLDVLLFNAQLLSQVATRELLFTQLASRGQAIILAAR